VLLNVTCHETASCHFFTTLAMKNIRPTLISVLYKIRPMCFYLLEEILMVRQYCISKSNQIIYLVKQIQ